MIPVVTAIAMATMVGVLVGKKISDIKHKEELQKVKKEVEDIKNVVIQKT